MIGFWVTFVEFLGWSLNLIFYDLGFHLGAVLGPWDPILGSYGVLESHLRALGASWDPPGGLWGTLGVLMGALVELLGRSWGALGVLGVLLGCSWSWR